MPLILTFESQPPGSFTMGSTDGGADETPVHKVTIAITAQMEHGKS